MIFLDCTAASEKSDEKYDATNHHQQNRSVEERITQKVQVVAVHALNDTTRDDQSEACDLQNTHNIVEQSFQPSIIAFASLMHIFHPWNIKESMKLCRRTSLEALN